MSNLLVRKKSIFSEERHFKKIILDSLIYNLWYILDPGYGTQDGVKNSINKNSIGWSLLIWQLNKNFPYSTIKNEWFEKEITFSSII